MNLATRKRLFNSCDPREPLAPDDARNVDVDGLDGSVRGRPWVDALAAPVELARRPVRALFTGQAGSGVTTELLRLSARLGRASGANLLVVNIDGEEAIDLHSEVAVADVLFAVLERTYAAVAEAEPIIADGFRRFQKKWLADVPAGMGGEEARVPASLILRSNPSARMAFRGRVGAELSQFVADVRSDLVLLEDRARRLGRAGIVVIFDGLTKLRGVVSAWRDVLLSAEGLFARDLSYLDLPVHVVYTVPPAIVPRLRTPVHFLPQLRIFDRQGGPSAGLDAGREIVRRRVAEADLYELFGADRDAWTDRLIAQSAGNPRAIVRLLQEVVVAHSLEAQAVERVLSMGGDEHRRIVPADAYPWLARVHVDKTLPVEGDEPREIAELMISNGVVLRYQNGEAWYDVHPSVRRIPGVEKAIQELRSVP